MADSLKENDLEILWAWAENLVELGKRTEDLFH